MTNIFNRTVLFLVVISLVLLLSSVYECFAGQKNNQVGQSADIVDCSTFKNYLCKKCETLLRSKSTPSTFNCPSGGLHIWTDLGCVGKNAFQCKKCAVLVRSKNAPSSFNCPAGKMHDWHKL